MTRIDREDAGRVRALTARDWPERPTAALQASCEKYRLATGFVPHVTLDTRQRSIWLDQTMAARAQLSLDCTAHMRLAAEGTRLAAMALLDALAVVAGLWIQYTVWADGAAFHVILEEDGFPGGIDHSNPSPAIVAERCWKLAVTLARRRLAENGDHLFDVAVEADGKYRQGLIRASCPEAALLEAESRLCLVGRCLFEREPELIRLLALEESPTSAMQRAIAGLRGSRIRL